MPAKIEPGGKGRVPYLLRCAFVAAAEGDRGEALNFWNMAVAAGYRAKQKTRQNLLFRIDEGEGLAALGKEYGECRDHLLGRRDETPARESSLRDRVQNRKKFEFNSTEIPEVHLARLWREASDGAIDEIARRTRERADELLGQCPPDSALFEKP